MLISKIESKIVSKKKEKKVRIEIAAFELFAENGFNETSVDQIAKKANVAKGTFYLYYKEKSELLHHIIFQRSVELVRDALQQASAQDIDDHIERMIYLTNYVTEFLKENKSVLKIINKNLSWSILGETIKEERDPEIKRFTDLYIEDMEEDGYTKQEAFQLLFMIIEFISTVCYSAIILNQPDNIDNLKPMMFKTIRKMLAHN